ncbi:tetratricopeptide repeat protein [Desulfosporosinus acidiphilus SJ4]|uniref:Tetratricopeptide repeat protein n=1 Tax=Desulfosporosinus acidiphilus (strain DSM 22704 / JCM 16185 / SJ4) TaxID=646529 RepID=I4D1E7_DESAJ|nr:tetratricopeptide repeat protein [Desulfosporosinus acidiphilus]AFM39621.1 tetratricopeptide repeat protein [Desulfosporosinus acidiphilus SJ4]
MQGNVNQKFKTIVIFILLAVCLIGAGAFGYFYNSNNAGSSSISSSSTSNNSVYLNTKNRVNTLIQQLKASPNDIGLQEDLGNSYYDLGTADQKNAPNEAKDEFTLAVKNYQNVLKSKQDINVMTDMATAAFYSGQQDLAEKSYQKVLTINPNFSPALFNYGIYLYQIKKDNSSAIRMWQTVLNQDPNSPYSEQLKTMISQVKG